MAQSVVLLSRTSRAARLNFASILLFVITQVQSASQTITSQGQTRYCPHRICEYGLSIFPFCHMGLPQCLLQWQFIGLCACDL